ncbi:MAG: 16S rRNA (cytidine(1402)-2'-O)-methyltransferase, partial [Gemmatimonadota bacterium]
GTFRAPLRIPRPDVAVEATAGTGPAGGIASPRMGTLYIVSTPIGNLEDLSLRAARILGEVEAIFAEDTRRSSILVRHLGHTTPLVSLHAHNEASRTDEVMEKLGAGASVALISDAGTPLLSDPGERVVERALTEGHTVVPVPGPSAILHALVGSGFPNVPFVFLGFPPRKGKERNAFLARVAEAAETVVLFEAPGRTGALLSDLETHCGGDRRVAVAREMTKLHEEFRRGTLKELSRYYLSEGAPRGEITIVVAPPQEGGVRAEGRRDADEEAARILAGVLLRGGESPSRVARELSRRLGISRNQAYEWVQEVAEAAPLSEQSDFIGDQENA